MDILEDDFLICDEYENLRTALEYAAAEYKVVPFHKRFHDPLNDTYSCSCGDPGCKRKGRHIKDEKLKPTLDEHQIREWWMDDPIANIGVKAGCDSYLMVEAENGTNIDLPDTYFELFDNSVCYYFKSDHRHKSFSADGIIFTGDDGYIAAGDWMKNQPKIEELSTDLLKQLKSKPDVKLEPKETITNQTLTEQNKTQVAPEIDFIDEKNNSFDGYKMMQFLGKLGVAKIVDEENTTFVQINNGLVENITPDQIQDLLMKHLEGEEKTLSALHENVDKLFSKKKLRQIPQRSIITLRDYRDRAFLPFKNGLLEITKDGYELIEYDEDMLIWKHQLIDREWEKDSGGDFEQFILNTSTYQRGGKYQLDQDDYVAKTNTIGYLLHTYKDPAEAKCVILTDASLLLEDYNMNNIDGRTGKSAFCEAVGKIRNVGSCDGMNTRIGFDRFALQNVKRDHQLILFDDARKNFNFQNLFHMITGSLTIEGKNKAKFSIPFKESPKFIITTNYPFEGDGESFKGRQHIVQFSDFYNTKRSIVAVHGKRFFEDWDENEWHKFDSFMAGCLQDYLKTGKLEHTEHMNYELKKLNMPEFIRWAGTLRLNTEHCRKHLRFLFQNEYPEKISQTKFNKMLRQYAEAVGYKEVNKKSGGTNYVTLVHKIQK
jgi:hypothetical protein